MCNLFANPLYKTEKCVIVNVETQKHKNTKTKTEKQEEKQSAFYEALDRFIPIIGDKMLVTKAIKAKAANKEFTSLLKIMTSMKCVEVNALISYAKKHNFQLEVIADELYLEYWGVSPNKYWEHVYLTSPIVGVDEKEMKHKAVFLNRLRFNPFTEKGLSPAAGGFDEEDTWEIFLSLRNEFTVANTCRLNFKTLEQAVTRYWEIRKSYGNVPLLFSPKKGNFIVGKKGGIVLFKSFNHMKEFFGEEDIAEYGLFEVLDDKKEEVVSILRNMPGARRWF